MTNQLLAVLSALAGAMLIVVIIPLMHGAIRAATTGAILFFSSLLLATPFVVFGLLDQSPRLSIIVAIVVPFALYLRWKGKEASGVAMTVGILGLSCLGLCEAFARNGAHSLSPFYLAVFVLPLLCLAFHQPSAWIPKIDRINVATTVVFLAALSLLVFLPFIIREHEYRGYLILACVFLLIAVTIKFTFFKENYSKGSSAKLLKLISLQEAILLITFLIANISFLAKPNMSEEMDIPDIILRGFGLGTLGFFTITKLIIFFGEIKADGLLARISKIDENLLILTENESNFLDEKIDDKKGATIAATIWASALLANFIFSWQDTLTFMSALLFFSPLVHYVCVLINDRLVANSKVVQ